VGARSRRIMLERFLKIHAATLWQCVFFSKKVLTPKVTMPAPESGRDSVTEKQLRPVATELDWRKQRKMWKGLAPECGSSFTAEFVSAVASAGTR